MHWVYAIAFAFNTGVSTAVVVHYLAKKHCAKHGHTPHWRRKNMCRKCGKAIDQQQIA